MTATKSDAAIGGLVAAAAALGTAELVAGLVSSMSSLVVAVADLVVDTTPGPVVRWSIDTLGRAQKPALVAGVVVLALALGALFGVLARRRFWVGAAGFVAFGVLGALAAARGSSSDVAAWLSAGARHRRRASSCCGGCSVGRVAASTRNEVATAVDPAGRRRFLLAAGAVVLVSISGAAVGRFLRLAGAVEEARARLAARLGSRPAPSTPAGVEAIDADGITPLVTPNDDFYRIDTALLVPQVDPDGWSLRITGMVDRPLELDLDELLAMDLVDEYVTLSCVSNEVGGDLVGNAWWSGVPSPTCSTGPGCVRRADQIVGRSVDGWTAGFPTEVALDGRPAMVAVAMNGEPLPGRARLPGPAGRARPLRLRVGHQVARARSSSRRGTTSTATGSPGAGPRRARSRPSPASTSPARARPCRRARPRSPAWPGRRPGRSIGSRCGSTTSRGSEARLSGELSDNSWVQWVDRVGRDPGCAPAPGPGHRRRRRDPDRGAGGPAPDGATGWHTVRVQVGVDG